MNTTSARATYDAWHDRLEVDVDADAPWHRLLFAHLEPRDLAARTVLEVACGRGGLACRIAGSRHRPSTVVAADFSAAALVKGRQHALNEDVGNVRWSASDLQSLAFRTATFDTVISCESIEHVEHPRRACAEFARVLKPSGRLYLTTPNYLGPLGLYRAYLRSVGRRYTEAGQPINRFMVLPLTCWWLKQAGFRIVSIDGKGHYLPWPGRPPVPVAWLDSSPPLRWVALHSLVVAEKA